MSRINVLFTFDVSDKESHCPSRDALKRKIEKPFGPPIL